MNGAVEYRQHAATCLRLYADLPLDHPGRSDLLEQAVAWHNLADEAERNSCADIASPAPLA